MCEWAEAKTAADCIAKIGCLSKKISEMYQCSPVFSVFSFVQHFQRWEDICNFRIE